MANRSLGTLTLDLIAQTGGFTEGMTKAERSAERANQKIRKETAQTIDTVAKWGAATVAAAAAVGVALGAMVVQQVEAVAAQNDLAQALGITHRELVTLERAAGLSGVASDELSVAMKKLNKTIGDAQAGGKSATEALAALGLKADELSRMPMDQRFQAIAVAVSGLATQTERAAAVQDIMGKSAQALLPMLQDQGATLAEAARQTREWGLALSEIDVANIAEADDSLSNLAATTTALRQQMAAEFAPVLTVISERLIGMTTSAGGFRSTAMATFEVVAKAGGYAADVFSSIHLAVKGVEVAIDGLSLAFSLLLGTLYSVGNALDRVTGRKTAEDVKKRQETITKAISASMGRLAHSKQELVDIYNSPLPHENVDKFFRDVEATAKKTAAQVQQAMAAPFGQDTLAQPAVGKKGKKGKDEGSVVIEDFQTFLDRQAAMVAQNTAEMRAADETVRAAWRASQMADLTNWEAIQIESAEIVAKREQDIRRQRFQETHEMLGNLSTLMNTQSRKMFEIGKAAAIANSLVSMYEGATKSYTALAGIPFVGPALAFGAKAAAIASGLASIAAIRSVSFGGGGGGASGVSNTQAVNAASTPVGNAALGGGRQTFDLRILGTSRPSWDEVAQAMEMIGERLADSGGRLGKVTVVTQ